MIKQFQINKAIENTHYALGAVRATIKHPMFADIVFQSGFATSITLVAVGCDLVTVGYANLAYTHKNLVLAACAVVGAGVTVATAALALRLFRELGQEISILKTGLTPQRAYEGRPKCLQEASKLTIVA